MIEYVRGTVADKSPTSAILDVGGVGYGFEVPLSTFEALPDIGEETTLVTHHHVREDVEKLFGFATKDEREAFRRLISVSQVGPKVGLAILSSISVDSLAQSVAAGDPSCLKAVPGIGPKTASRLVLELKGKLDGLGGTPSVSRGANAAVAGLASNGRVDREAFEAMVSLGYSERQVEKALQRVAVTVEGEVPIEEWIRRALQVI